MREYFQILGYHEVYERHALLSNIDLPNFLDDRAKLVVLTLIDYSLKSVFVIIFKEVFVVTSASFEHLYCSLKT